MKKTKLSVLISLIAVSQSALAGGYLLSELGELSTSTAGAGSAAIAEGAETAFANPAGMTRLKGENISANLGLLNLDSTYYDMGTEGNLDLEGHHFHFSNFSKQSDMTKVLPMGSFYYTNELNDKFSFGLSFASTGGSGFEYENGFAGSLLAESGMLLVAQLNPSVAYKVNDKLSLGAGVSMEYAMLNQTLGTAAFDNGKDFATGDLSADDVTFGWNVGAMYQFDDANRLGFTYRSKIDHELKGDIKADVDVLDKGDEEDAQVNLIMPAQAKLSGYHAVQPNLALLWTIGWQDLSAVKQTDVILGGHNSPVVRDWKDTYSASIGGHFKINNALRFELGYSYETSPQDDPEKINVDVPTGPISKYSTGLTWSINSDMMAQFYYEYLDGGTIRTQASDTITGELTNLNGVYDMNVHFLGAVIKYSF